MGIRYPGLKDFAKVAGTVINGKNSDEAVTEVYEIHLHLNNSNWQ